MKEAMCVISYSVTNLEIFNGQLRLEQRVGPCVSYTQLKNDLFIIIFLFINLVIYLFTYTRNS